jgi:hypothetical protein
LGDKLNSCTQVGELENLFLAKPRDGFVVQKEFPTTATTTQPERIRKKLHTASVSENNMAVRKIVTQDTDSVGQITPKFTFSTLSDFN